jgi:hypothetical protein
MRKKLLRTASRYLLGLLCLITVFPSPSSPLATKAAQKMKPEELIAKHLESIGSPETLASIKSRVLLGEGGIRIKSGQLGQVKGPAVMASENDRSLIGMTFGTQAYPHEKMGFDGRNLTIAWIRPGTRSSLGDFFKTNIFFFREGLIGGVLSSAWPLLDGSVREARLEYGGLKKIGDKQLHEIKYIPRKGTEFSIRLFFDAENFHHVRSEYLRTAMAQMGGRPDDSARQRETRYTVIEEFSDFKKESGLTLPHTYKLQLSINAPGGLSEQEWTINLIRFAFNQKIPPESFNAEAN